MKFETPSEIVQVDCYSGGRFAERPVSFGWRREKLQVAALKQAWQTPDGVVFLVRVPDSRHFELTYAVSSDQWTGRQVSL